MIWALIVGAALYAFLLIHLVRAQHGISLVAKEVYELQRRLHMPSGLKKFFRK